jgi:hypothetical protein
VALDTIDAFVAVLRSVRVQAVIAILRLPDDVAIHAVLVPHVPKDEVTIAATIRHVAVIAVLAVDVHEGNARNRPVQNGDLFKE